MTIGLVAAGVIAIVAIVVLCFSMFGGSSSGASNEDVKLSDSISFFTGKSLGLAYLEQNKKRVEENGASAGMNTDKFISGFEAAITADTTHNFSYLQGQKEALYNIVGLELTLRQANVPFYKDLFLKGYEEGSKSADINTETLQMQLADMMAQINNKGKSAEEAKSLGETISSTVGQYMGAKLAEENRKGGASQMDGDLLFKGIKSVVDADTTANMSYIHGMLAGNNQFMSLSLTLRQAGLSVNPSELIKGFKEAVADPVMSKVEVEKYTPLLQERLEKKIKEKSVASLQQNDLSFNDYINKLQQTDSGIVSSPTGLYYKIITPGSGKKVNQNSTVRCFYKMSKIDGSLVDQTAAEPFEMQTSGVIPGFAEGLTYLSEGGKAIFYIPGNLAYGEQGVPQAGIGPNEPLVAEVEVVTAN